MLSSRVPSRPGLSASDRIRSALARVKTQPMSTVALQTDEWRKALAQGIQRAGWPYMTFGSCRPLWNYVNADAAHKEAQVGGSYKYAQI